MTQPRDEARALRSMVDEVRAEPMPPVDWDRVEAQLLERIARRDRPRYVVARPEAPSAFGRVIGYVAVAAAVALAFSAGASPSSHASGSATEPRVVAIESLPLLSASAARDVSRLQVGEAVETGAEAATFELAGAVRWTLAPNSRAVVRARAVGGVGHVVALERGAIEAEVTPRDPSEGFVEAFAVEAGGTRVAVHGTLFRVVLEQDRIVVDVEHGTVAVGPTGHVGVTTGRILVGPARAAFSLDGGRTAGRLDRRESIAVAAGSEKPLGDTSLVAAASATSESVRPQEEPADRPAPVAPRPGPAAAANEPIAVASPDSRPAEPATPAPPVLLSESGVQSTVVGCIKAASGGGASGVVVRFSSTLKLIVQDDGSIKSGRFDPPLKPELQNCAGSIMGGRFSPGARTITIPVSN